MVPRSTYYYITECLPKHTDAGVLSAVKRFQKGVDVYLIGFQVCLILLGHVWLLKIYLRGGRWFVLVSYRPQSIHST